MRLDDLRPAPGSIVPFAATCTLVELLMAFTATYPTYCSPLGPQVGQLSTRYCVPPLAPGTSNDASPKYAFVANTSADVGLSCTAVIGALVTM